MACGEAFQLPQGFVGRSQNMGAVLLRQINSSNSSNPADKIPLFTQSCLARGLSGGTRFLVRRLRVGGVLRFHAFQKQAQGASGEDIGTSGDRCIGGYFPHLSQNTFVLFGHMQPCAMARSALA